MRSEEHTVTSFYQMRVVFLSILSLGFLYVGAQLTPQDQNTSPLDFKGSLQVMGDTTEIVGKMNRAWKYSFGQEPAAKLMNKSNHELVAKAHFYFLSELITNRQDTRGVIAYQVKLKAENGKCLYEIHQFIHRGNTAARSGGMHFGRLMKGAAPDGNIRGISQKNIQAVHQDMKKQIEARVLHLLSLFKQHISLNE